jgi:hypothetical protein
MRSFIGSLVKQYTIVEIMENHRNLLRDGILGKKPAEGERTGRKFRENGMRIYDLELREIVIDDKMIEAKLIENQRAVVDLGLSLQAAARTKEKLTSEEKLKRDKIIEEDLTSEASAVARKKVQARSQEVIMQELNDKLVKAALELQVFQSEDQIKSASAASTLQREKAAAHQQNEIAKLKLEIALKELQADVDATTSKAKAVTPDLVAALVTFADKRLASDMVEHLGKLQFTNGENVAMILRNTVDGLGLTGVSKVLSELLPKKE